MTHHPFEPDLLLGQSIAAIIEGIVVVLMMLAIGAACIGCQDAPQTSTFLRGTR